MTTISVHLKFSRSKPSKSQKKLMFKLSLKLSLKISNAVISYLKREIIATNLSTIALFVFDTLITCCRADVVKTIYAISV